MPSKKKTDEELSSLLHTRKYDPAKPPPEEQIIFSIEGKNIGSIQNFVTITGMQKSGKTTFLTAMIASALTGQIMLGMQFYLPEGSRRVVYFDTEQGDYDFHRTMERVKSFCNADKLPPLLDGYNLREDEPKVILWLVEKYLDLHPDCGMVVIDGILDMIESYNDESESKKLINALKRITKARNVLALLTLHIGKTTANTLGHLGAMADRAAQSVLHVEKNKETNTFVLRADYLRSAEDFTPIETYFNKNNHTWEQTTYNPEPEKIKHKQPKPYDYEKQQHQINISRIFSFSENVSYRQLVQDIQELYGVGTNWAKECVTYFVKESLIFKTVDGYTNRLQAKLFTS